MSVPSGAGGEQVLVAEGLEWSVGLFVDEPGRFIQLGYLAGHGPGDTEVPRFPGDALADAELSGGDSVDGSFFRPGHRTEVVFDVQRSREGRARRGTQGSADGEIYCHRVSVSPRPIIRTSAANGALLPIVGCLELVLEAVGSQLYKPFASASTSKAARVSSSPGSIATSAVALQPSSPQPSPSFWTTQYTWSDACRSG
jgi:hypothetical protein